MLLYFSFILLTQQCSNTPPESRASVQKEGYRILSYNVENLFDTYDEPNKFDDDFTPYGDYLWGKQKYIKKLKDIGKVIVNTSYDGKVPAVIGLIEVENRQVLEDLVSSTSLEKFEYSIVHEESPDERGIDVALLYDKKQFTYIEHDIIRIDFPKAIEDKTRDILLVSGVLATDTICFAVNHWPSRRGGASRSEPKRMFVAKQLKSRIDELAIKHSNAGFVIMGDFNDMPSNRSIREGLNAKSWNEESSFINLMSSMEKEGLGTYKYQNQWNMLDQFMVSKNLTDEAGSLRVTATSASIFDSSFLKEPDSSYPGDKPFRTFRGPKYNGGYSDHFPIVLDIEFLD